MPPPLPISFAAPSTSCKPTYPPCQRIGKSISCATCGSPPLCPPAPDREPPANEVTCLAGVVRTVHPSSCSFLPFPFRLDATSVPHKTCLSESHLNASSTNSSSGASSASSGAASCSEAARTSAHHKLQAPFTFNCLLRFHLLLCTVHILQASIPSLPKNWQAHLMRNLWQSSAVSSCT